MPKFGHFCGVDLYLGRIFHPHALFQAKTRKRALFRRCNLKKLVPFGGIFKICAVLERLAPARLTHADIYNYIIVS